MNDEGCRLQCQVGEGNILFSYNYSKGNDTLNLVVLTFDEIINHEREEKHPCEPSIKIKDCVSPSIIWQPTQLVLFQRDGILTRMVRLLDIILVTEY